MAEYRVFQGHTTRQIDGHTARAAQPQGWYYEPTDYEGDVLYSVAYATRQAAEDAATIEEGLTEPLRLDTRIDGELDRLGWSSTTAPEGASTLDCWNTPTTEEDGLVTLHDPQEVTMFRGEALLEALRQLPEGISWEALWHAILPHSVQE